MIIKRIELVNYCQHEHRVIDVSGNLIAVVGHNGVGKSNFLGALQFALTGEQPGKTKADLLHWGAKEGYVVLDFEQDGKPGHIERYVSSNKVTLEYDGVTTSGITNVAKEMETRLHMDKDLVRQSVFVRQKEVDAIISAKTDKRDREVAFQKLLGLDAAKIHKNMTDWLYSAEKPMNYDIQLADAARKLGELETRKAALDADVKAAEANLAEFGEVDESQGANLSRAMAAVSHVLRSQAEVGSCAQAVTMATENEARAKQAAVAAGAANPGYDLAELAGQEAVLKDEIRKIHALELGQARLQDAQAQAARVVPPSATPEDIAKLAGARDAVAAELATVRSEMAMRAKSVKVLNGDESVCPVCGKVLDAGMVERLRNELKALEQREADLAGQTSALDRQLAAKRMDLDRWTRESAQCNARVEAERAALAGLEAPKVPRATVESVLETVTAQLAAQRAYDTAMADHAKAVSDAEIRSGVAEKALSTARAQLAAAEAEARRLCGDEAAADWSQAQATMDAAVKETDRRRARHTELRMAVTRSTATRDEAANTIASMKQTVASLKEAQAAQDRLAKRLKVIEDVRDLFHYANLPRVLVAQALDALTGTVNQLLGNFTAPFIAIPDQEQVGFRIEFTDGRACRAEPPGTDALSGGECVQLAVAFRLAIYRMFAGKLGLLSLDEPTAYLDDANVDRFGVLLTKVRELARDMHTQILMATHERAVMPHMDSVIDLN